MVKHIVIWRLKDFAMEATKQENAYKMKQMLEDLNGKIPGLLKIEVGIDFSASDASGDVVLYSEFPDRSALDAYQAHPEHKKCVAFVKEVVSERRLADYET
ncbi:MAG: stress responsive alpha-beta barrel domain-containing protein [Nitrospirae bacterium]|nr:MAG: stress responsive alpha-beta barrel domain-containing protein [Nitrospirota bacterium]